MRARTLGAIRKGAPRQDLNSEALAKAKPTGARRFAPLLLKPTTLHQLRTMCEPFGELAEEDARWAALTTWAMWAPPSGQFSNPNRVVNLAVLLCREHDRMAHGYPNLGGKPWTSRLDALSPEVQAEARLVASEAMAEWERAGRPRITKAIEDTYKYLAAYIAKNPQPKQGKPIDGPNT